MNKGFDRKKTVMYPLSEREHKLNAKEIYLCPKSKTRNISDFSMEQIKECSKRIKNAKSLGKPVILTYGAHIIKNGGSPVINALIKDGWITHVAVNGAGSIHDWEFAFIGESTEDVRKNTATGSFGTWDETGKHINLAVAIGGTLGLGYGSSVGKMIYENSLHIPSQDKLKEEIISDISSNSYSDITAAKIDLLNLITEFDIPAGNLEINHKMQDFSVQYTAFKKGINYTVHPGIGYDIIYTHPYNNGGAIGRGAVNDFLCFAESVSNLTNGGVFVSVGSAIMSPMIFEKSMSMSNNFRLNNNLEKIKDYYLGVIDIQDDGNWDWSKGEPPMDNPAYYLRFCKTFHRMGGDLQYICLDNRDFILNLYQELEK